MISLGKTVTLAAFLLTCPLDFNARLGGGVEGWGGGHVRESTKKKVAYFAFILMQTILEINKILGWMSIMSIIITVINYKLLQ